MSWVFLFKAYEHKDLEDRIIPLTSFIFKISRSALAETKERLRDDLVLSDKDGTQVLSQGICEIGPHINACSIVCQKAGQDHYRSSASGAQKAHDRPVVRW